MGAARVDSQGPQADQITIQGGKVMSAMDEIQKEIEKNRLAGSEQSRREEMARRKRTQELERALRPAVVRYTEPPKIRKV